MLILPKAIYKRNPYKNPNEIFAAIKKIHPKIHTGSQGTLNSQTVLKKNNKTGGFKLPDLKTYHQTTAIKIVIVLP